MSLKKLVFSLRNAFSFLKDHFPQLGPICMWHFPFLFFTPQYSQSGREKASEAKHNGPKDSGFQFPN